MHLKKETHDSVFSILIISWTVFSFSWPFVSIQLILLRTVCIKVTLMKKTSKIDEWVKVAKKENWEKKGNGTVSEGRGGNRLVLDPLSPFHSPRSSPLSFLISPPALPLSSVYLASHDSLHVASSDPFVKNVPSSSQLHPSSHVANRHYKTTLSLFLLSVYCTLKRNRITSGRIVSNTWTPENENNLCANR